MTEHVKALALSTIHLCDRPGEVDAAGKVLRKAEIRVVPAGQIFEIDRAQFDEFARGDHVRVPTVRDIANVDDGGLVDLALLRTQDQAERQRQEAQRRLTRPHTH